MASRFWQRYRRHPLLAEIAERAAYFTKAVAAIYIVRENLVEFTVVRARDAGPGLVPVAAAATATACRLPPARLPSLLTAAACPPRCPLQCVGPSMMPTFNPRGDVAILEHVSVWSGRIAAGDVVLARSMQNPRHMVCKRVLGLEGDIGGCWGAARACGEMRAGQML